MLQLKRLPEYLGCTPGHIFYDGAVVCSTLELPWKDNLVNVSCIPAGEYPIAVTHSNKFKKKTLEILDVPNRDGVRVHTANLVTQLEGCIAPCKYLVVEAERLYAQLSTEAYDRLEALVVAQGIKKIVIV